MIAFGAIGAVLMSGALFAQNFILKRQAKEIEQLKAEAEPIDVIEESIGLHVIDGGKTE